MENRSTRRLWSKHEKRQIVEGTLKPGASVSVVARAHDVNANQVFRWRKLYREGHLESNDGAARLLPVKLADIAVQNVSVPTRQKSKRKGFIDIDLGHARVRIEGEADPDCVRAALQGLLR